MPISHGVPIVQNKGETVAGVQAIKSGEKDLMDSITADLDWGVLQEMIRQRHHLEITDDLEFSGGDIVVHENQVAYRLNFEVKVVLSVLLDREGRSLAVHTPAEIPQENRAPAMQFPEEITLAQAVAEQDASTVQEEDCVSEAEPAIDDDPLSGLPDVSEMTMDALAETPEAEPAIDADPLSGLPDVSEMTMDALAETPEAEPAIDNDPLSGLPDVSEMTMDALAETPEAEPAIDNDPLSGLPDVSEMTMDALAETPEVEPAIDDDPLSGLPDVSEMTMDALAETPEVEPAIDDDPLSGLPDVSEMTMDALAETPEVEPAIDDDPLSGLPDVSEMTMDSLMGTGTEGISQGVA